MCLRGRRADVLCKERNGINRYTDSAISSTHRVVTARAARAMYGAATEHGQGVSRVTAKATAGRAVVDAESVRPRRPVCAVQCIVWCGLYVAACVSRSSGGVERARVEVGRGYTGRTEHRAAPRPASRTGSDNLRAFRGSPAQCFVTVRGCAEGGASEGKGEKGSLARRRVWWR